MICDIANLRLSCKCTSVSSKRINSLAKSSLIKMIMTIIMMRILIIVVMLIITLLVLNLMGLIFDYRFVFHLLFDIQVKQNVR